MVGSVHRGGLNEAGRDHCRRACDPGRRGVRARVRACVGVSHEAQTMTARVIHSECLDWLRAQPDNSIDAIVTDRGWFDVVDLPSGERGLVLREIAPGETVEGIREVTGAAFEVARDLVEVSA